MSREITMLIGSLAIGGAENVCVSLANGLCNKGYKVTLLVLNLQNAENKTRLDNRINLVNLGVSNVRYSLLALYKYIKNSKEDKILVFDHLLATILLFARLISFRDFKIIARNINTLSQELNNYSGLFYKLIVKNLVKYSYKKVDFVINQSQGMMVDLIEMYPEIRNKTTFIHNPVNEKISNVVTTLNWESNLKKDCFLCVGRLDDQKAFHYAIKAFAIVVKKYPHFKLKIVGTGKLENNLKDLSKQLKISDKVYFEGFQKNTIKYYLEANATILTSLYEGFPNVLIESITLGTPVISFDCPSGPAEIVREGENGFLTNYLDLDALVNSMCKACEEKFDYQDISKSARVYNIENVIEKYNSVIKGVI